MTTHISPDNLTPKQVRALSLLAQGDTAKSAAKAVKVSEATMVDWRRLPAFEATLNRLKLNTLEATRTRLQAATHTAVATLEDLASNAPNAETRRRASLDLLTLAGFAPSSQQLFANGIGPTDPDKVRDKQREDRAFDKLMKDIVG